MSVIVMQCCWVCRHQIEKTRQHLLTLDCDLTDQSEGDLVEDAVIQYRMDRLAKKENVKQEEEEVSNIVGHEWVRRGRRVGTVYKNEQGMHKLSSLFYDGARGIKTDLIITVHDHTLQPMS